MSAVEVHPNLEARARQSLGSSGEAIYQLVASALERRRISGKLLVDVGCGTGGLLDFVNRYAAHYVGVDVIHYEDFPAAAEFKQIDLDTGQSKLPNDYADIVVAVETIEHLENPRAFMRELIRLAKPGGWVIVTTPNQLSLLSLLTLVIKKQYQFFQEADYPAHITALLEIDLTRIANECGLVDVQIEYSMHGRLVFTNWHYPRLLARLFPRLLSDNVLMIGRKQ